MKWTTTLVCTLLVTMTSVLSAAPVEFVKADNRIHSKYGTTWQTITVEVEVENLAHQKNVQLYYKNDANEWLLHDFVYAGQVNDHIERWSTGIQRSIQGPYEQNAPLDIEFVIRYDVNGETYWANNGGANYYLKAATGEMMTRPLTLEYAMASAPRTYHYNGNSHSVPGYLSVDILVANLGYEKKVDVYFSYDNWATTHVAKAQFQSGRIEGYSWVTYPNENNIEVWRLYTNGPVAQNFANEVQFAIRYEVNGQVYWDNNHGANYRVQVNP